MIQALRTYIYDRRSGLVKTAAAVGGFYIVKRYVSARLEEAKEGVMEEQQARDNLKRRFMQNQEDVSYTIMALLPTLGEQILAELDVEGVTHELQTKSRAFREAAHTPEPTPAPEASEGSTSMASSMQLVQEADTRSDAGSASISSLSTQEERSSSRLGDSTQSWDQLSASAQSSQPGQFSGEASSPSVAPAELLTAPQLSDSITTASSSLSHAHDLAASEGQNSESSGAGANTRSKAELWREVKMLTFTRTLTILYSTTLLSLFTSIQLTLLARSKYVHSIMEQEREERLRERVAAATSISSLLFGGGMSALLDMENLSDADEGEGGVSEEVEVKYLTLSWWILHVGWKDIGERVRRGVEEVFENVSLKTKLGTAELHALVGDVRRRVEYEVTFEGRERRIDFLSSLLPPTTETMQHVLTHGGIGPWAATHHDAVFTALLDETRSLISSSDFARVLEVGLDNAVAVLFDGVEKNVFVDSTVATGSGLEPWAEPLKLRLAGLLPGLARWSHLALNALPNELVDNLTGTTEMSAFSAIIFSKFEDRYS